MTVAELTTSGALAIQFPRIDDRHGHAILLHGNVVATSVEGDGDDDWPPSPPLQQLSIEDLGAGPVALLVGMAGRSHWSLSIEASDSEIVFDAACRVNGDAKLLGSTYQLADLNNSLRWTADQADALAHTEIVATGDKLFVRVVVNDPAVNDHMDGATIRWRYRARVAP